MFCSIAYLIETMFCYTAYLKQCIKKHEGTLKTMFAKKL